MSTVSDIHSLKAAAELSLRQEGNKASNPNFDWPPTLILHTFTGVISYDLHEWMYEGKEAKNFAHEQVAPMLVMRHKALRAAYAWPVWMRMIPVETEAEVDHLKEKFAREGIRNDPQRTEVVFLALLEPYHKEAWWAPIRRHRRKPPKLGQFTTLPNPSNLEGRMVDPIQRALVAVSGGN